MFEPDSRYYKIPNTYYVQPDGKKNGYKQRRFLPDESTIIKLGQINIPQEERLDILSWKTLGNPKLAWRICDANPILKSQTCFAAARQTIQIPKPQV